MKNNVLALFFLFVADLGMWLLVSVVIRKFDYNVFCFVGYIIPTAMTVIVVKIYQILRTAYGKQ